MSESVKKDVLGLDAIVLTVLPKKQRKERKKEVKARRGKGEGSIVWNEERQRWVARLEIGKDTDGKPITKYLYAKKNEKAKLLNKMEEYKRIYKVGYTAQANEVLENRIIKWLTVIKKPSLKPSSYDRLESAINNHVIPKVGFYQIGELDAEIIQKELINPMVDKYSYSSVKKVYDSLNEFLKYAVNNRELIYNPMALVNKPNRSEEETEEVKILNDIEIGKFLTAVNEKYSNGVYIYQYGYAYVLILNTGIRMGEMLALRWTDIDFEKKEMSITKNAIVIKNRDVKTMGEFKRVLIVQNSTKTKKSNRIIKLNQEAISALMILRQASLGEYVITTRQGNPVHPAPFQATLNKICNRAKIECFGVHALRHTFASKMLEAKVDIKVVSKILGHNSVVITYDTYVHVIERIEREAMEAISFYNPSV